MHPSGPKVMKLAPEAVANEVLRVGGVVVRSRLSIPPAVPLRNGFSMRNFASPLVLRAAGEETQVVELESGQVADGRSSGNVGAAYLGDLGLVPDIDGAARSECKRRVGCRGQGCVHRRGRRSQPG